MKSRVTLVQKVVLLAAALSAGRPALAGRMDQVAADLYEKGVQEIQSSRYEDGEKLILEALSRGAVEPNEAQGTESRYLVRKYDPYYWLGVAKMETGSHRDALRFFSISERYVPKGYRSPVITRWTREYLDLKRRKAALVKELGATIELVNADLPVPQADAARSDSPRD